MINELDCALKPKAYTKIVQASMKSVIIKLLSVQLEENYFHQFQVRFLHARPWSICTVILSDAFPLVPALQSIYQNVLEISALTSIIFILVDCPL